MKSIIRWGRRAVIAGALLFSLCAGLILADGLIDETPPSDVAVVLGSKVNPDGTISPRLAARLGRALELHRAGTVQHIIVSGGTGEEGVPEGTAMKAWLVAQGVPEATVIVDDQGADTRATARNSAALMKAHGFDSAIVVSQYFHIARTKLAFAQEGVPGVGSAHPAYFEPRDLYSLAREVPGYASYLLR